MSTRPAGGDGTSSIKLHTYLSIGIEEGINDNLYNPHINSLKDDANDQ